MEARMSNYNRKKEEEKPVMTNVKTEELLKSFCLKPTAALILSTPPFRRFPSHIYSETVPVCLLNITFLKLPEKKFYLYYTQTHTYLTNTCLPHRVPTISPFICAVA